MLRFGRIEAVCCRSDRRNGGTGMTSSRRMNADGTVLTDAPARIRTWLPNHPAPTSDLDGKSRVRPWVQNPKRRPEGCRRHADLFHVERSFCARSRRAGTLIPLRRNTNPWGIGSWLARHGAAATRPRPVQAMCLPRGCCDAFARNSASMRFKVDLVRIPIGLRPVRNVPSA